MIILASITQCIRVGCTLLSLLTSIALDDAVLASIELMLLQALIRSGMISFDLALNFLFDLSSLLLLGLIVRVNVVCEHVAKDVVIPPLILL